MSEKEKRTVYTDELNENLLHMLDGQTPTREQVETIHRNRRSKLDVLAFDFETANRNKSSVCALGVVVVELVNRKVYVNQRFCLLNK